MMSIRLFVFLLMRGVKGVYRGLDICVHSYRRSMSMMLVAVCLLAGNTVFGQSQVVFTGLEVMQNAALQQTNTGGQVQIYQGSQPQLRVRIINNGPSDLFAGPPGAGLGTGFITCVNTATTPATTLFRSSPISSFLVQAGTSQDITSLFIPTGATATAGITIDLACEFDAIGAFTLDPSSITTANLSLFVVSSPSGRFDSTLQRAKNPIQARLDTAIPQTGAQGIQEFILRVLDTIVIPLAIIVGVVIALIGFYRMFFSESEDSMTTGLNYILWGVVGIVVMMVAPYIATTIYSDVLNSGENAVLSGVDIAGQLYDWIVYPLLKLLIYIAIGFLFVTLIIRVFSFLNATSADIQTKSRDIIITSVIGILLILGSNQIIEFVYSSEADVRNQNATTVSDIGNSLLNNPNFPLLYEIIRWVMGLAAFFVLAIIIYQTIMLLLKPDDEERLTAIKDNIVYVFIGVLVIGAGYLITNFLIIN